MPEEFPKMIILTGYRATGKSSIGSMLAKRLGYDFFDTDAELESALGCTIAEYVDQNGWPAFRSIEKELLRTLTGRKKAVIATGGGAIQHTKEWEVLRKNSRVIWLQADAETIRKRLAQDGATARQRPTLTGNGSGAEVEKMLQCRNPLYCKGSDLQVDTASLPPEEVVKTIIRKLDLKP
jgi:shikimate kinase